MARGSGIRESRRMIGSSAHLRKGRAIVEFWHSKWSAQKKRWVHVYYIHPPAERRFLPSDLAIERLIATVPGLEKFSIERRDTYDYIKVRAHDHNLFTKRASEELIRKRVQFLEAVAALALADRIHPYVMQVCDEQFLANDLKSIVWNGRRAKVYDLQGYIHTRMRDGGSWVTNPSPQFKAICELERACLKMEMPPFTYGAAL